MYYIENTTVVSLHIPSTIPAGLLQEIHGWPTTFLRQTQFRETTLEENVAKDNLSAVVKYVQSGVYVLVLW